MRQISSFAVDGKGDVVFVDDKQKAMSYLAAGSNVPIQLRGETQDVHPAGAAISDSGQIYSTDYNAWLIMWPDTQSVSRKLPARWGPYHAMGRHVLAVDSSQNIYLGYNNDEVLWISASGEQHELFVEGMSAVNGVAAPANGDLYILGWMNDDKAGHNSAVAKYANGASTPQILVRGLDDSSGLTATSEGTVYVVEDNGSVVRITPGSATATKITTPDLHHPYGIASDAHGNLYVGVNTQSGMPVVDQIVKFSVTT
jgi:hypothetical protein